MKNKKIIFWNLDKKSLINIESGAKYIIISNKNDINFNDFKIKPIIITHHGSKVIDLESNKIITDYYLTNDSIISFIDYASSHNVNIEKIRDNKKTYELKLTSSNYYRMLILPAYIKEKYSEIATIYNYPFTFNKKKYINYVVNKKVKLIDNIITILDYLNIESNDILRLTNVSFEMLDLINRNGYCITNQKLKLTDIANEEKSGGYLNEI